MTPRAVLGPGTEAVTATEGNSPFSLSKPKRVGGLGRASPHSPTLTGGAQEGAVELSGNQRIRHVPEKFLEQSSHVVDA